MSEKTYLGALCRRNHDAGGGHSIRWSKSGSCTVCNTMTAKEKAAHPIPGGRTFGSKNASAGAPAGLMYRPSEWLPRNLAMIRRRSHPADRESYLNGVEFVWGFEIRAELEAALTITEAMTP